MTARLLSSLGQLAVGFLLLALAPPVAEAAPPEARRAQVIETQRLGVDHPAGLAWSRRAGGFVVLPEWDGAPLDETELRLLTHEGQRSRRRPLPLDVIDPLNVAFDNKAHRLLLYDAQRKQILEVAAGQDGVPDPETLLRHPVRRYGIRHAQGMTADPVTGRLFILDAQGPRIVVIEPDADGDLRQARVHHLELSGVGELRGLAFDASSGDLHAYEPAEQRLYQIDDQGVILANRDLSEFSLREPQAMVFAPSGDGTDDPAELSLYVAEAGTSEAEAPTGEVAAFSTAAVGQISELSMTAQVQSQAQAQVTSETATLVQVIQANEFDPPSPDSMGIAYVDAWDSLLMSDSEVNEISNLFTGDNLFEVDYQNGTLIDTASTIDFSNEPTGVAYDPVKNIVFIAHDNSGGRLFVVEAGNDGVHFTNDDDVTLIATGNFGSGDPEGITFDRNRRSIFIAEGLDSEVYELDPGPNDVFGDGDDSTSHFDTSNLGATDPEAITWDTQTGNLLLLGNPTDNILEISPTGTLIRTIDINDANPPNPSGLGFGPHSGSPGLMSVYISDRGVDNDSDPDENDGQIFEITFDTGTPGNLPPVVNAGPDLFVTQPDAAVLDGTVTGEPGETVTSQWFQVGGPGTATFANPSNVDTTATFSEPGVYILRLTADDGELSANDDATVTVTGPGGLTVVEIPVSAGSDDAEEPVAGGSVSLTSSDLEMTEDGGPQIIGIRFNAIPVPPGASISNAWIQFQADETDSIATSLTVRGQAANNAATFTSGAGSISSRATTGASVGWAPPAWTSKGQAGPAERTPDLAPVIAEIVGRPGWSAGNALALIITGSGKRTAESFNGSAAPILHLEYTTTPNDAPTVNITSPADGSGFDEGTSVAFSGNASDTEDGTLTGSLSWNSSLDGPIGAGGSFSRSDLTVGTHVITASVIDSGGRSGSDQISVQINGVNTPPTVSITSPGTGSSFGQGETINFAGTATDPQDGSLSASLVWTSNVNGIIGSGPSFSRSDLSPGPHTITASVTDSGGLGGTDQISLTVTTNTAPTVTLSQPTNGASFDEGDSISFAATATDAEDGTLTASLAWTSNLDGGLGNGGSFSRTDLSPGTHLITASVTDSGGASGSDQATITVNPSGPGGTTNLQVQVSAASDDAEEKVGGGVSLTSSDLEFTFDSGGHQTVGIRFAGVNVPPGASILNAWVQFQVDEVNTGATSLTIRAQAADNAPTFTSTAGSISVRPTTTASVGWSPPGWTNKGEAGPDQRTPNLASVVGEVVGRAGWFTGNALALIVTGTGERTAESFNGGAPPVLHVEYSSVPNDAPVVNITSPAHGSSFEQTQPVLFAGTATDTEDGVVTSGLSWSSSLDGALGSGATFSRSDLSVGTHVITASVIDSGGRIGSAQVTVTITTVGGGVIVEIPVSASSDDAEEESSGAVSLTSSDLELTFDGGNQTIGVRFAGVPIPQGATIVNAWVQFETDETDNEATSLTFRGQAADHAATFTSSLGNISSRPTTGASVGWAPVPWTVKGEAGPNQRTPSLVPIVSAIVGRAGWSSGNALALIITGTGVRTAESFNGTAPAVLHVEYQP